MKAFIDEPFVVMFGVDIKEDSTPLWNYLINNFDKTLASPYPLWKFLMKKHRNMILLDRLSKFLMDCIVSHFVGKPAPKYIPSDLAFIGR